MARYVMKKLVNAVQMSELDRYTIDTIGIPSLVLMERAALAVAGRIREYLMNSSRLPGKTPSLYGHKGVLVLCGSGNNGGDGIAVARILHGWGISCAVFLAGSEQKMTPETKTQLLAARNCGVTEEDGLSWEDYEVIVDALLGIGLCRQVEGKYRDLIRKANGCPAWKIAVDIPSGVDALTGQELGLAFRADETVTFAFGKTGLYLYPGKALCGRIHTEDIGIYDYSGLPGKLFLSQDEDLDWLRRRDPGGNKGTFGKVLIVAGSIGMSGAAYLCARGAFGTGTGMVKIQTVPENRIVLQQLIPEAMLDITDEPEVWQKDLDWCDSVVIGPGLGQGADAEKRVEWFLQHAIAAQKPVVLDADGLNLFALHSGWQEWLPGNSGAPVIFTPHMGEMSRLTGVKTADLTGDRIRHAREYAASTGTVMVLKDASTVTAAPDGTAYLTPAGNSGMACAGSGDVLAGILGGICARSGNLTLENSHLKEKEGQEEWVLRIASGVYLHGLAGDMAARAKGQNAMTASDLTEFLSTVTR